MAHSRWNWRVFLHSKTLEEGSDTTEGGIRVSSLVGSPIDWALVWIPCFSAVGGTLFTFGSVLLWAWMKGMLPKNNGVLTFAGLTSGFMLARLSADYLENLDSQVDWRIAWTLKDLTTAYNTSSSNTSSSVDWSSKLKITKKLTFLFTFVNKTQLNEVLSILFHFKVWPNMKVSTFHKFSLGFEVFDLSSSQWSRSNRLGWFGRFRVLGFRWCWPLGGLLKHFHSFISFC